MRHGRGALAWLALGVLAAGCATAAPEAARPAPPPVVAAPPPPPAPRLPTPQEEMSARHNARSEELERAGDLPRALDERKIALTINPDDRAAKNGRARLQATIEQQVTERMQQGRAALARGSQLEARRNFLAALALDPQNRAVFDALQSEVREVEVLTHTVRQGETLASVAQRYYGDAGRGEVIAEANQLSPGARLTAGRTLRVPEIPGVPFARPEPRPQVARVTPKPEPGAPPALEPPRAPETRDEPEVDPLLQDAQEALQRNAYGEALHDLDRLLASKPGNAEALTLKKRVLYQQARAQLNSRSLDASYKTLTALNQIAPNYEDTSALLQQVRRTLVDQHYSQGIRLFRQEKLAEAIGEWRLVLELEPQHANARRSIEQAERLLKSLDERRKK